MIMKVMDALKTPRMRITKLWIHAEVLTARPAARFKNSVPCLAYGWKFGFHIYG